MSENIDSWDAHHKFLTLSETFYGAFFEIFTRIIIFLRKEKKAGLIGFRFVFKFRRYREQHSLISA